MTTSVAIEARGITKRFPGVLANDHVDFTVAAGEVHALLGENGAGKSTLAAILCGLYTPDEGEVRIGGVVRRLGSPRDGLAHGVGMVHQHFRLVEQFTVAENVVLGDPRQPFRLRRRTIEERVAAVSDSFGLPVEPRAVVADLTVGERQRVELVKMLYRGADVVLLDEPTAVLTPQEVDALFVNVAAMTAAGKAIVFISHKLHEVLAVSDRITVMRAGAVTGEVAATRADQRTLAEMMVGRAVELPTLRASAPAALGDRTTMTTRRPTVMEARGISLLLGDSEVLRGIDLDVRAGEVLGVAGVAGNGQRELAEVLAGVQAPSSGTVHTGAFDITGGGPMLARARGVAFVPEDRLGTGLVPGMSMLDNQLLTRPRRFFLDRRTARAQVEAAIATYDIKTPGPTSRAGVLSGGNAQKALLARELAVGTGHEPSIVIVASPTRGLDVGAIEFVRSLLHDVRERGGAVLLISEDLDEVRSLADRMVVLYEGQIQLEGDPDQLGLTEIGMAMAGVHP